MKTPKEISQAFLHALDQKGEERLVALRGVLDAIQVFECEAATNYKITNDDLRRVRSCLPELKANISRLEAGARRTATMKASKAASK